jgi:hypothetical protein
MLLGLSMTAMATGLPTEKGEKSVLNMNQKLKPKQDKN